MCFVVLYAKCMYMYCVVLYIGYRCVSCVVYRVYVSAFMVSHIMCGFISYDVYYLHIRHVFCIVLCCTLGVYVVCQV